MRATTVKRNFIYSESENFTSTGSELFFTGTLKPERFLILILEELEQPLVDTVSSLLIETNYIEVVNLFWFTIYNYYIKL